VAPPNPLSAVSPITLKPLYSLAQYLEESPDSNLFSEYVYEQPIKAKGRTSQVMLISAEDFFSVLELYGITSIPVNPRHKKQYQQVKKDIEELLCLEADKHRQLFMVKKINKLVNSIQGDPQLQAKIKQAEFDNDLQGDSQEEYDDEFIGDDSDDQSKEERSRHMHQDDSEDEYQEEFEESKD
jgi:hypothetical protein